MPEFSEKEQPSAIRSSRLTRRGFLQLGAGTLGTIVLAGCAGSSAPTSTPAAGGGATASAPAAAGAATASNVAGKTIGFSMSYSTTEWLVQQRKDVEQTAAKYGLKTIVLDAADNPGKEVTNIEDLVTKKVDVLLISTYYSDAITPAVEAANKANIPVVVLSSALASGTNFTSHLSVDTLATAQAAGKFIIQKLGGKGKVAEIDGKPGSVVNQQRGKGFRDVIAQQQGVELVANVVANYDRAQALTAMEAILRANPQIDCVYSHAGDMSLGALQAAREAKRDKGLWFVTYDGITVEQLQAVYDGVFYIYYYLPFGTEGVEVAVRILQGKKVPKEITFPSPLMTKENVTDWYDPATKTLKTAPARPIPEA